jgi:hypothetical protein
MVAYTGDRNRAKAKRLPEMVEKNMAKILSGLATLSLKPLSARN